MLVAISLLITYASAQQESAGNRVDNANTTTATGLSVHQGEWILEFLRTGRMVVNRCNKKRSPIDDADNVDGNGLLRCVEMTTLRAMDRLLERDVIELPFGLKFIKATSKRNPENETHARYLEPQIRIIDMKSEILARLVKLLTTHSLRIPLPTNVSVEDTDIFEGRRRHHRRHKNDMMGLMLFGMMAMAVIAIPLGFQFLAVLGGKALMLAKLALILTSIQGLKKIATSNFNYGLYQAPHTHHSRPWLYDRRWQNAQTPTEHQGIFDGFDVPTDSQHLDAIRPRIMLRRVGFTGGGAAPADQQQQEQI